MDGMGLLNALAQVATSVGLSATLILFFVWQSWKREEASAEREQKLQQRLEVLEDTSRKTLIELTKDTTSALISNTDALRSLTSAFQEHHQLALSVSKILMDKESKS